MYDIKNKVDDQINIRNTEINTRLTAETNKINDNFSAKIDVHDTKISAMISKIIDDFSREIVRINERNEIFVTEAQEIINRIREIEKTINDHKGHISNIHDSIAEFYEFRNEVNQQEEARQRIIQRNEDVFSDYNQRNETEQTSPSILSSDSSGSSHDASFFERVELQFKQVFNSIRDEQGDSVDYMCETVSREIRILTKKKIGASTVKGFYYGERDPKYSTVKLISRWVLSKENISLDNHME